MAVKKTELIRHNPYFNRWFSAILFNKFKQIKHFSHNPYFNRWFSAIQIDTYNDYYNYKSQSLF